MTVIPEDAHVMLAAAVSTRNVTLITDTIMCITDLVTEIQGRFTVAIKPGAGRPMTFGSARSEVVADTQTSFPCSKCDRKFSSVEDLNGHSKGHALDEDVHSATQRLHALTNTSGSGGSVDQIAWSLQSSQTQQSSPGPAVHSTPIAPTAALFATSAKASNEVPQQDADSATLKCPLCSKMFNKIFQLNLHLARHQEGADDTQTQRRTYSCRFCAKEFYHMNSRHKHERACKSGSTKGMRSMGAGSQLGSLSQVFNCRKCRKPYADNANRLRHERMCRSGTNSISLAGAGALPTGTAASDALTKPASTSSLELPISVNNYKQMASSAVHMKVLDENGRQANMYTCVICAKLLQTRSSLESHYMSHLGIKPHACQWCGKRFTDSSNWRKHQRGCTERPINDFYTSNAPTMAPPASSSLARSSYSYSADASLSSDYQSLSTSQLAMGTPDADDSLPQAAIKQEAVDISSDGEVAQSFPPSDVHEDSHALDEQSYPSIIDSSDESKLQIASPIAVSSEVIEEPVPVKMDDDSEENAGNSVVVDSALSWFVEDKELTALHQDQDESMS